MLEIQKKFINYNFSNRNGMEIKYIIIHDTGNQGATALDHYDYFNSGDKQSSADFFVDINNIIQLIDYTKYYSWAVGDGKGRYGITNSNSISIEMCLVEPYDVVIQNTLDLVMHLMKELNISIENVKRHYDASLKSCPNSFAENNWAKWYWFKEKLKESEMVWVDWKTILRNTLDSPEKWETAIQVAVNAAKADGDLGALEIFEFLPTLIEKIYNQK